jgi:DNA-directed RNA polymerase specialized sigma24 family protein
MSRARVKLTYTPQWSDVQAWAIKTIHQNKWRCDRILEPEDLLSEAYLVFAKVAERYPRVVEHKHFFSLFKTALRNYLHDQARYMKRKRMAIEDTADDPAESDQVGETSHDGAVRAQINSVFQLKIALEVLERNPRGLHRAFAGRRENLNMKLHRVTGLDYDFMGGFRDALSQ